VLTNSANKYYFDSCVDSDTEEHIDVPHNVVMKRDAMLPWTYGEMQTMASALKMSIAWPYNKVIN